MDFGHQGPVEQQRREVFVIVHQWLLFAKDFLLLFLFYGCWIGILMATQCDQFLQHLCKKTESGRFDHVGSGAI